MKRKLLLFCGFAVMAAILAVGTLAYFTTTKTADIPVKAGSVELEIREKTTGGGKIVADGIEIMPGDTVSRIVAVENTGSHPFYARIKVTKSVEGSDLSADTLVGLNIDEENWTYIDGFFYYNHVILAGETTPPLFTEVLIGGDMDNQYLGKKLLLNVAAYAVQSENNGDSPLSAAGWPEE